MAELTPWDVYLQAEEAVCDFVQWSRELEDTRAAVVRAAYEDPQAATARIAEIDARLASAATVKHALWSRRAETWRAHRDAKNYPPMVLRGHANDDNN